MIRVWMRAAALALCLTLALCGLGLAEQPREFVTAPEGTKIFGLTVGEPVRMGEAAARAARGIAAEFDAADFGIWGADALLNDAECGALATLDPVEQVLAVLLMAGYEQETYDAVSALGLEISGEAQALVSAVYKRFSALDSAGRGAWGAAVESYFTRPDGAQLTLRIGEQLIRYGFRRSGEEWILDGISIAR